MSILGKIGENARAKTRELVANAQREYTPQPVQYKLPRRKGLPSELRNFVSNVQPGEGWMYSYYPNAGYRRLFLSHMVQRGRMAVFCSGGLPADWEKLPMHLANFKTRYATELVGQVKDINVICDYMGIEIKQGGRDIVPVKVYETAARCLFDYDPDLQTIRFGVSEAAAEAARINGPDKMGTLILRSELESPPGPAPTTPPGLPPLPYR